MKNMKRRERSASRSPPRRRRRESSRSPVKSGWKRRRSSRSPPLGSRWKTTSYTTRERDSDEYPPQYPRRYDRRRNVEERRRRPEDEVDEDRIRGPSRRKQLGAEKPRKEDEVVLTVTEVKNPALLETVRPTLNHEPVSLEDLLQRRREEAEKAAKPVFVSRKDREREALARLSDRRKFEAKELVDSNPMVPSQIRDKVNKEEEERDDEKKTLSMTMHDPRTMEVIRKSYAHQKKEPKALVKPSEKFRFRFEWDESEDTTKEDDPFYAVLQKQRYTPGFGKGHMGGIEFDKNQSRQFARAGSSMKKIDDRDPLDALYKKKKLEDSRHWSEKSRDEMTERDWRIFREDHSIAVRGGGKLLPARSWEETGLPDDMLRLVRDVAKYEKPSPIQMATIPIGIQGRDLIGLAETGSGKTAAFVLPMLVYISRLPPMTPSVAVEGPYAIILTPTRELAQQIEVEATKFAQPLGYRVMAIVGGLDVETQGSRIRDGCEIVIATPGRMIDCLDRRYCVLNQCYYVVLDEADRMIDMGFEPQVQTILDAIPASNLKPLEEEPPSGSVANVESSIRGGSEKIYRQTFLFSATMPPAVERIARQFIRQPIVVAVGETGRTASNIEERVEFFPNEARKRDRLAELLRTLEPPIIVFVNTKKGCDALARTLESTYQLRVSVLHAGKSQDQREDILHGFRSGRHGILLATDVLSRGIDIKGVNHVINFEMPTKIEPYTHRIGRTGRAGRKGVAWSLTTPNDSEIFPALKRQLDQSGALCPPEITRHESVRGSNLANETIVY